MFYPEGSIHLEDIKRTLNTSEKVKEVYSENGRFLGWIVYDSIANPFVTGKDNISIIRCCQNCQFNKPGTYVCTKFNEERRSDSVCKCWMKSGYERNKKIFKFNLKGSIDE